MENKRRKLGFTIVELLTVMAIIAILMGLLLPAMQAVRKLAKDTSQKAQFKTIETGLEAYAGENGMYPESSVSPTSVTLKNIGAHKLCEALVGRDLQGFDPKSSWNAESDETSTEIYADAETPQISNPEEINGSLKRRQNMYLAEDKVEAFQIGQLFNDRGNVYPGNFDNTGTRIPGDHVSSPVMTDVYRNKKVTLANGKTLLAGTPILYYKADTRPDMDIVAASASKVAAFPDTKQVNQSGADNLSPTISINAVDDFIYDVNDNDELIKLFQMMKPTSANRHHFDEQYTEDVTVNGSTLNVDGVWLFYDTITNAKMTKPTPYNRNTYILISAGYDGIYGTKDDIYNFEK
jgi:prepilin-type N-terminal cleavage/methylation domain-containing protein